MKHRTDKVNKLLVSFSGGETSARMAIWINENWKDKYEDILFVFANTGQENEETLAFVQEVDAEFGLGITWVEAEVNFGQRKGNTHRVVDFESASRGGEPFESTIKKYGIPNKAYPHCTRELKDNPIRSYAKSLGWEKGGYHTAIGIRNDEIDRISVKAADRGFIYPLITDEPMTKKDINYWWSQQGFRLPLKDHQGNCKWCWKKSLRKHMHLIRENPDKYVFPARMERTYPTAGHNVDGTHRVFFREGRSCEDLFALAKEYDYRVVLEDASRVYSDPAWDTAGSGCSESCEAFAGD